MSVAGLLLILAASLAQAAHMHGEWLPHHDAQVRAQSENPISGDDGVNCPLCIAMHSAMAVALADQPAPRVGVVTTIAGSTSRIDTRVLHFSLFGRPPPVSA